jgi:hypothetical protein
VHPARIPARHDPTLVNAEASLSALDLAPLLRQHRPFAIFSSFALALLYAEEGWASHNFWPARSNGDALVLIASVTLIAFAGYLISFLIPPMLVAETWDHPRAWGVLSNVTAWSAGITIAVNVVAFALLIYLVNFNLIATYNLLRDIYIYTIVAMLFFHGLLLYIRYMTWLYQTPDFVQPLKVVAASVGIAVIILVVGGFLFTLDIQRLEAAPPSQEGLLGLHVYMRSLYLVTLIIGAYAWHLRWIADH